MLTETCQGTGNEDAGSIPGSPGNGTEIHHTVKCGPSWYYDQNVDDDTVRED
jgi:hypothetical protein